MGARATAAGIVVAVVAASGLIVGAPAVSAAGSRPDAPTHLRANGGRAPIGVSPDHVHFSWYVRDPRRGAVQTAYRIVVRRVTVGGPSAGRSRLVWDTGEVRSPAQLDIPYAGPRLAAGAVYRWRVRTWDAQGVSSPWAGAATFETGLRNHDWHAHWIRRTTRAESVQYTYARVERRLRASPIVRARAYVSADQQYALYVNGVRAGKGQAYSYADQQYYETRNVTRLLRAGQVNAVGALTTWDGATKNHPAGEPGLIIEIRVQHRDGTRERIITDGAWRVTKANWLPGTGRDLELEKVDYTENIDGATYPTGWAEPGFNASTWTPATDLGRAPVKPWTHLVASPTRIVETPVHAVSVKTLANGAIVADFGKVYAARPTVLFHHGVPGHAITMRAGYLLDEPKPGQPVDGVPGQVSTQHGTQHTDMSYSYVERLGRQRFVPFDYLGFRYFQVDDPGETLTRNDFVALARHARVPSTHAGWFASSNPTVDAVFRLGRHSALYSMQEYFIDTPTREKGPWLWDGFNESVTAMDAFGDQAMARKSLLEYAASQRRYWPNGAINKLYPTGFGALDINEFTEIYPEWVWQYWLHSGDKTLLRAVYPAVRGVARYVHHSIRHGTGLVTALPSTSIYYAFPTVTRINILGVNVFRRAAQIASVLHRPQHEVALQRGRAHALTHAINARLTRRTGVYVDGRGANGSKVHTAVQETNACALAFGVVPPAHRRAVTSYVARRGMAMPPRTAGGELLEALRRGGRDAALLRLITDRKHDGWANILARGGTFTWEVWQPSDQIGDSMSHGWGSNVLVGIQQALLGVRPTGPGFATFVVAPPRSALRWASGGVPTPRGPIRVRWRRPVGAAAYTLAVTVPANAHATVRLPASQLTDLTEGGHPIRAVAGVESIRLAHGIAVLRLGSGHYRFRSTGVPRAWRAS